MTITYEAIMDANSILKKYSEEKGADAPEKLKEYVSVSQRVKAFRKVVPDGSIQTEELPAPENFVKFKATLTDGNGMVLATGHAIKNILKWNKYDKKWETDEEALQKCETKAVGRALAYMGLGIDAGIASAEELEDSQFMQLQNAAQNIQSQPQGQVYPTPVAPPAYQAPQPVPQGYVNPQFAQAPPQPAGYYASQQ